MLGDVGPEREASGEGGVEDCPEDDGNQEGEGGYCGVEEVVEGLERAGEAVSAGGAAVNGVGEGVEGGHQEVEGCAPVAED